MKKKYYLVLDTETATLPFVNEITVSAKDKKKIAIAKPLVYDIGWTICDRNGNIAERRNFLVQETFFVPNIFNTAYYKEKRPFYMDLYQKKEIECLCWNDIIELLIADLRKCDFCTAYNATFDFKKAIPFTERYIKALYSANYQEWENRQKELCKKIMRGEETAKNEQFLEPLFILRNEEFPMFDLWGLACDRLLNNERYKDFCLQNQLLSPSGMYFSTSAENTFRYLIKDSDFIESHTALSDAEIETQILIKILKRGKINADLDLKAFPFRALGYTYDYVQQPRKQKYAETVIELLLSAYELSANPQQRNQAKKLKKMLDILSEE